MKLELAFGLVIDLGGLFGQGEGDANSETFDGIGDGDWGGGSSSDSDFDFFDDFTSKPLLQRAFTTCALFLLSSAALFAQKVSETADKAQSWYHHLAFYIGPVISFGPIYFTGGACLGGFGCFAVGGGIKIGNWGIGVLFPIWIWW